MNSSIAVVILNWNGLKFLQEFVPILIERSPSNALEHTIYIADNGSTDGSIEWLQSTYSHNELQVVTLDRNYGFTGGYNRAFEKIKEQAYHKYYILLNSDVEVSQDWLSPLHQFMEERPEVGICGPKVRSYHNREYFEYAGACGGMLNIFGYPYCRGRNLFGVEKDKGQYDTPTEIFWASGTSLMIRSELWHELGGLEESFFAHMEEIDLCWRAKRSGHQVWIVPQSVIYHVGGGTLSNNSPNKLYLNFRNNLLMLNRNLPPKGKKLKIFFRQCLDGVIAIIYLLTGKVPYFKAVIRAHKDYRAMISGYFHFSC